MFFTKVILVAHIPSMSIAPETISGKLLPSKPGINAGITIEAKDTCPISLEISAIPLICSFDNSATYSLHCIFYFTKRTETMSRNREWARWATLDLQSYF